MSEEQVEFAPTPLNQLFGGDESPESETASAAAEVVAGENESSPDSGDGEAKAEESAEAKEEQPAQEAAGSEKTVPLAALEAERAKFKQRIAELEANQNKPEATPAPSVFEDEEGFNKSLDQKVQTAELRATLRLSKTMLAKEIGDDGVQAVWDKFSSYMAENPQLEQRFAQSDHPFEYAKQQVERYDMLQKIETGEIDQELESRVEKMLEEKLAAMGKESADDTAVPRSLAASGGSGVKANSYAGPTPLSAILAQPE